MGSLTSGALGGISQFPTFLSLKGMQRQRKSFLISATFISCDCGWCRSDFTFYFCFHSNAYCYQLYLLCGPTTFRLDIKFTSKFSTSPVWSFHKGNVSQLSFSHSDRKVEGAWWQWPKWGKTSQPVNVSQKSHRLTWLTPESPKKYLLSYFTNTNFFSHSNVLPCDCRVNNFF